MANEETLLKEKKHCFTPQGKESTAENIANVLDDLTDIRVNGKVTTEEKKASVVTKDKETGKLVLEDIELGDDAPEVKPITSNLYEIIIGDGNNWADGNDEDVGCLFLRNGMVQDGDDLTTKTVDGKTTTEPLYQPTHFIYSEGRNDRYYFGTKPVELLDKDGNSTGNLKNPSGNFMFVEGNSFMKAKGSSYLDLSEKSEVRVTSSKVIINSTPDKIWEEPMTRIYIDNSNSGTDPAGEPNYTEIAIHGGRIYMDGAYDNEGQPHSTQYWTPKSDYPPGNSGTYPTIIMHDYSLLDMNHSSSISMHDFGRLEVNGNSYVRFTKESWFNVEGNAYVDITPYTSSNCAAPTVYLGGSVGIYMDSKYGPSDSDYQYGPAFQCGAKDLVFFSYGHRKPLRSRSGKFDVFRSIDYFNSSEILTPDRAWTGEIGIKIQQDSTIMFGSNVGHTFFQVQPGGGQTTRAFFLDNTHTEMRQNSIFSLRGRLQNNNTDIEKIHKPSGETSGSKLIMRGNPVFYMSEDLLTQLRECFGDSRVFVYESESEIPKEIEITQAPISCVAYVKDGKQLFNLVQKSQAYDQTEKKYHYICSFEKAKTQFYFYEKEENSPYLGVIDNSEINFSENASFKADNNGIVYNFGNDDIHFSPEILSALASLTIEQIEKLKTLNNDNKDINSKLANLVEVTD